MPKSRRVSGGERVKSSTWRWYFKSASTRLPSLGWHPMLLADWHQTNWFTVQGAEKRAIHATGVRPGDPTADIIFAFAFARFHRKLVERLRKKGLLPEILHQGGRMDACADHSEEIHIEPPAYMDDFFLPVISDTAAELLPRFALATQITVETARRHGLQLNMDSNKTEANVDFRGKGRQRVLEDLSREFPVVDGQWTPTVRVAGEYVPAFGDAGLPRSKARSGACSSSHCCEGGVPCHAQAVPESKAPRKEGQGGGRARSFARGCSTAPARGILSATTDINAIEDTYMAPFRTIANERWRPGHIPASSQEVCRRLGILDFQETVSMQRLRSAALLVNAAPSLLALLQSDAGRAWKDDLARGSGRPS